jgi:hypothetical protein
VSNVPEENLSKWWGSDKSSTDIPPAIEPLPEIPLPPLPSAQPTISAPLSTATPTATPTAVSRGEERRFYAIVQICVLPIGLIFLGIAALGGIAHARSFTPIPFFGVFVLVFLAVAITQPSVAIVSPDSTLTFKSLRRTTTTSVAAVNRIVIRSGGRGGTSYRLYFNDGQANMSDYGGTSLATYLVKASPGIECPERVREWASR